MNTPNIGGFEAFDRLAGALQGFAPENGHFRAMCPAHEGHRPALSLSAEGDPPNRKILLHCHAGCGLQEILDVLNLTKSDLFEQPRTKNKFPPIVAAYDYVDLAGNLLFQVPRHDPKDFRQRRPDGNGGWIWSIRGVEPVLYNLPAVTRTIMEGGTVFVCEGEKDCDRANEVLGALGTFTTCAMGSGKWRDCYTQTLRGADVVLIPDNDGPGHQHAEQVARDLLPVANSVKVLALPGVPEEGGDLSDWLDAGGNAETFEALVSRCDLFKPDPNPIPSGSGLNKYLPFYTVGEIKEHSGGSQEEGWFCPLLMKKGEITLFGGEAKRSGKTTLYMHALKATHDGTPFLGMPTTPTKSLVLTEQGNNILEATTKAGIRDDEGIFICPFKEVSREKWPELIAKAVETCKAHDLGILVIDTFSAFARLRGSDENLSGEILERMEPIIEAARVHDLHVSLLHHTGKDGDIRGSSAFAQEPDIIWTLKRPPGDHGPNVRALEGLGRHDAVNTSFNIALEDDGYVVLGTNGQIENRKARSALMKAIPVGKDKAKRRKAVLDGLSGVTSASTLQRALEDLIEAHAVREETQKGRGNPKILWRPEKGKSTPADLFKSDSDGTEGDDLNKNADVIEVDFGRDNPKASPADASSSSPPPYRSDDDDEERKEGVTAPPFVTEQSKVEALITEAADLSSCALDLEGDMKAKPNRQSGGVRVLSVHIANETHLLDLEAVDPTWLLKELENVPVYVHGAENDVAVLHHRYGFEPKHPPRDTLNLSRLAYAGEEVSNKLPDCLARELGVHLPADSKKRFQKPSAWTGELTEEHARYAAADVVHLEALYDALLEKVAERGLRRVKELEDAARPAFLEMQYRGVPVDEHRWIRLSEDLAKELEELRARILENLPEPPDEQGWLLDGSGSKRGVAVALKAMGYEVENVQIATLKRLAEETGDPVVQEVVAYREKSNAQKYAAWPEKFFVDGRIHPVINPHGAEDTGRATTSDPNLQGLDKGGEWRKCIRPGKGRKIVSADLAQIELRILAYVSGDADLFEALNRGEDLHKKSAEVAAGRTLDLDVAEDKQLRGLAKRVNFGRFYGAGAWTITRNLRDRGVCVDEKTVKKLLKGLADAFPGVAAWQNEYGNRHEFEVRSVLGRRRVVGAYEGKPKYTERLNGPIQTTGTDILKSALAKLSATKAEHAGIEILLSVHDEVLLEAPAGEKAKEAKAWLEGALRGAVAEILGPEYAGKPGVPSDCAEASIQDSWGG